MKEARLREIRARLRQDQEAKRSMLHFMKGVEPASSRRNIIPGETEAKDEAIRQQLLVGKLRYNDQLPGARDRFGGVGEPSISSAASPDQVLDQHHLDGEAASKRQDAELMSFAEARYSVSTAGEVRSRGIPQLLSDQASGLSNITSAAGSLRQKAGGPERERRGGSGALQQPRERPG